MISSHLNLKVKFRNLQFASAQKKTLPKFHSQKASSNFRNFSSDRKLEGKNAIVTGSTSGIGLGIARNLAKQGCGILLNGFGSPSEVEKIIKEISSYNVPVFYHSADMKKPEEIHSMVEQAAKSFGSVDILVNNAGIQFVSPVEQFPTDKWNDIIAINLNAIFFSTRSALPHMKKKSWGRIINISSVHGLVASIHKSAYVAAKHGVVGFTKTVALEYAGTGITANCINPGWVLTPLVQAQIEARAKERKITHQEASDSLLSEKQPSKQFVKVDDIANAVIFLSGEHAAQITGQNIVLDGGWTAQ